MKKEMGHATACWMTCGSVKGIEVYGNEVRRELLMFFVHLHCTFLFTYICKKTYTDCSPYRVVLPSTWGAGDGLSSRLATLVGHSGVHSSSC